MVIGGIRATLVQVEQAADALEAWPSTTIRPVLTPLGNPLAACDYHQVSAPFKHLYTSRPGHRGASGTAVTKLAFIAALRAQAAAAKGNPCLMYSGIVAEAMAAFARDESYAAEIARAAVAASRSRHTAALRARLRQSVHRSVSACDARRGEFTCLAESACGTGDCRFAPTDLVVLGIPAMPGRMSRPANHHEGGGFDPSGPMEAYAAARPFTVAIKVTGRDRARAQDEAAA